MKITRRVPTGPEDTYDVSNIADALQLPFMQMWARQDGFTRFSYSSNQPYGYMILAEYAGPLAARNHWWVVAFTDVIPDLPEWKYPNTAEQ